METSYMKLYQNIALRKSKIKSSKNSTQQLKKNKSLTYYHIEGQNNYLNDINDIKINCSNKGCKKNNECNNNYLLTAYKKGVFELFKALKSYMKKEIYKYNKIKNEFLQNIQKFYNEEKIKNKKSTKKNSTSMKKIITNGRKSNQLKENFINSITNNISSQTQIMNKTNNNLGISFLQNLKINNKNKISKHNINNRNLKNTNYKFNSFINHKSLYSLFKNNQMIGNSPLKYIDNCKNNNIIKKFIKFSNNISKNKNNKNNGDIIIEKIEKEKILNDNKKMSERTVKNNELISKIKDSLDENLKHILNFSYENFLNKESERDCN